MFGNGLHDTRGAARFELRHRATNGKITLHEANRLQCHGTYLNSSSLPMWRAPLFCPGQRGATATTGFCRLGAGIGHGGGDYPQRVPGSLRPGAKYDRLAGAVPLYRVNPPGNHPDRCAAPARRYARGESACGYAAEPRTGEQRTKVGERIIGLLRVLAAWVLGSQFSGSQVLYHYFR